MDGSVKSIIKKAGGDWGIYAKFLDEDKEIISLNAAKKFYAASVNKLAIALATLKLVEQGKSGLNEQLSLDDKHKISGTGVLNLFQNGLKLSVQDALALMLAQSDNTAAKLLVDKFGADNINNILQSAGLKTTRLDILEGGKFYYGDTTAAETGKILELLHRGKFLNSTHSSLVLEVMKHCHLNWGIERYLPLTDNLGLEVSNKEGTWEDNRHEAAIVWATKPYLLVILSANLTDQRRHVDNQGVLAIAQISKIIFEGCS